MATVLQNSDGKILRNSAGKILKQNYNIGKGLSAGTSVYLSAKIRGLSLGLGYTIDMVSGSITLGNNVAVHSINFSDLSGLHFGAFYTQSHCARINSTYNGVIGAYNFLNASNAKKMQTFVANTYLASSFSINYTNATAINSWTNETTSKYLPYGIVTSLYFNKSVLDYISKGFPIYEYRLYSRTTALNEIVYESNNGIFNEPLSTLGLECWYKFDAAELLDFSDALDGSDMRVGIRDFSGNSRHLEFIGLPAGTNAEKITYANTNLFVSW